MRISKWKRKVKREAIRMTRAHQEGNGGVHVEVLEVKAEEAHPSPKGPRVGEVVVDPEGQRQDLGQVSHRQVDHEDHSLGVLAVEK